MHSNFDDVGDFHEKFGLDNVTHRSAGPRSVDLDLLEFRIKFMREELEEFELAITEGDIASAFDALIDLTYVVLGTAHLLGLPWQEGWDEVHRANLRKMRAQPDGSDSVRGSAYDVVKPAGWVPPNISGVLTKYFLRHKRIIETLRECPQCRRDLDTVELREVIVQTPFPRVDVHCVCGRPLYSRPV